MDRPETGGSAVEPLQTDLMSFSRSTFLSLLRGYYVPGVSVLSDYVFGDHDIVKTITPVGTHHWLVLRFIFQMPCNLLQKLIDDLWFIKDIK